LPCRRSSCIGVTIAPCAFRLSKHLEKYFDNIANVVGDEGSRDLAVSLMCMMVGAVTLSRVMTDPGHSDGVLQAARNAMLKLERISCQAI